MMTHLMRNISITNQLKENYRISLSRFTLCDEQHDATDRDSRPLDREFELR